MDTLFFIKKFQRPGRCTLKGGFSLRGIKNKQIDFVNENLKDKKYPKSFNFVTISRISEINEKIVSQEIASIKPEILDKLNNKTMLVNKLEEKNYLDLKVTFSKRQF